MYFHTSLKVVERHSGECRTWKETGRGDMGPLMKQITTLHWKAPVTSLFCAGTKSLVLTAQYCQHNTTLWCFSWCLCYFSADKRLSRTPRRTQQPKTLNTPEDLTYYNLIHVSETLNDFRYLIQRSFAVCSCVTTAFPAIGFHNTLLIVNFLFPLFLQYLCSKHKKSINY